MVLFNQVVDKNVYCYLWVCIIAWYLMQLKTDYLEAIANPLKISLAGMFAILVIQYKKLCKKVMRNITS